MAVAVPIQVLSVATNAILVVFATTEDRDQMLARLSPLVPADRLGRIVVKDQNEEI